MRTYNLAALKTQLLATAEAQMGAADMPADDPRLKSRLISLLPQVKLTAAVVGWSLLPKMPDTLKGSLRAPADADPWEVLWYPFLADAGRARKTLVSLAAITGGFGLELSDHAAYNLTARMFSRARAARFIFPDGDVVPLILRLSQQVQIAARAQKGSSK